MRFNIRFFTIFIASFLAICYAPKARSQKVDIDRRGGTNIITSVPRTMAYQANLRDSQGGNVPQGDYEIAFRIYDALEFGNLLWAETLMVAVDNKGLFNAELGEIHPLNLSFDIDYYISLQVEGDPEMDPRQKIHMVPYAAVADTSECALSVTDDAINSAAIQDGSIQFSDIGQNSASSGQVMKWNGSAWVADDDETGSGGGGGWTDDGTIVRLETASDSVGIGTVNPSEKLEVNGNILVGGKANIGYLNSNTGPYSFVAGINNLAAGDYAVVSGGYADSAIGYASAVGGGVFNTAGQGGATIAGGFWNAALGQRSTVGGGYADTAGGDYATVSGGNTNSASSIYSVVSGGANNIAAELGGTVGGGLGNNASGTYSTVSGGSENSASGQGSAVAGGISDTASGNQAAIGGGLGNVAGGSQATIGGGWENTGSGNQSTVGGGRNNTAGGAYATIGGGYKNAVLAGYSAILGGYADTIEATADYSYLFGIGGKLTGDSTFMIDMPHIRFGDETDGFEFPALDGISGQVMTTDGNGQLSWTDAPGGGGWADDGTVVRLESSADSVGIGTSTPAEKLDVVGNILVNGKATIGTGNTNTGYYAFVAGVNNSAVTNYATVGGGYSNDAVGYANTIAGGYNNNSDGNYSGIGGGINNTASGDDAWVGGGVYNIASGSYAPTISGGSENTATNTLSTVGGGRYNDATGSESTIAGGFTNVASNAKTTVGGGSYNTASGQFSTVAGGEHNNAVGYDSFLGGGILNTAGNYMATVCGGGYNNADDTASAVGGGRYNYARGTFSVVAGGGGATAADSNLAGGNHSSILGGTRNKATGQQSTIGGGLGNVASGLRAAIGGGGSNTASGNNSTVAGGYDNTASGTSQAAVGGGYQNVAAGNYSSVPGGYFNNAAGVYSFAAGNRAKANHDGAFVWADSYSADFSSSAPDQFNVRASGGTRIYSNGTLSAGVTLAAGASSWSSVSDSTLKRNIRQVDGEEILEKLAQLPVSRWSYKAQDASIEHIGPTAQDFFALFGLGEDERHISTIDPSGVALAGMKELFNIIKEQNEKIERLEKKIEEITAERK